MFQTRRPLCVLWNGACAAGDATANNYCVSYDSQVSSSNIRATIHSSARGLRAYSCFRLVLPGVFAICSCENPIRPPVGLKARLILRV